MKGAGVAVLEKHGGDGNEGEDGIRRFKCDVGDRQEVERVWRRLVEEVSHGSSFLWPQGTVEVGAPSKGWTEAFDRIAEVSPWRAI